MKGPVLFAIYSIVMVIALLATYAYVAIWGFVQFGLLRGLSIMTMVICFERIFDRILGKALIKNNNNN